MNSRRHRSVAAALRELLDQEQESRKISKLLSKYRQMPADDNRGNPLRSYGAVHAGRLGSYWTIQVDVPLADLGQLRPVLQSKARLKSVRDARERGMDLPPVEIAVYRDGSAWIVDGNHRLIDARQAGMSSIPVVFTFVGA